MIGIGITLLYTDMHTSFPSSLSSRIDRNDFHLLSTLLDTGLDLVPSTCPHPLWLFILRPFSYLTNTLFQASAAKLARASWLRPLGWQTSVIPRLGRPLPCLIGTVSILRKRVNFFSSTTPLTMKIMLRTPGKGFAEQPNGCSGPLI
jgi:hypothetical protein